MARDRGIADLNAAMTAEPRITELARNPMLATLIALIHRFEAHLPGERAKLYEVCIKTLLDTWPAATGRQFLEIDTGLQRVYLEKLAYAMQSGRQGDDQAVVIGRDALAAKLSGLLGEREFKDKPEETRKHLAERWVNYLQEGSGLLVEQSTGQFAFFHLSFLEYLAARGWERDPNINLPDAIVKRLAEAAWREVCLLVVGVHAEDGPFLDALFPRLASADSEEWLFLLQALRDEACFTPEQRARILVESGKEALQSVRGREAPRIVDELIQFSVRNGPAVQTWIEEALRTRTGPELTEIVALRLRSEEILAVLESRTDRLAAARALLEFWPGTQVGDWAAARLEPPDTLDWAKGENELLGIRSLAAMALKPDSAMPAALSLAVASRALWLGWTIKEARGRLPERAHRGVPSMPETVLIQPGGSLVPTEPRLPMTGPSEHSNNSVQPPAGPCARPFTLYLAKDFARSFVRDFASSFYSLPHVTRVFSFTFGSAIDSSSVRGFAGTLHKAISIAPRGSLAFALHFFAPYFTSAFVRYLLFPKELVQNFKRNFDYEFPSEATSAFSSGPPYALGLPVAPAQTWLALMRNRMSNEEAFELLQRIIAVLAGEAIIALAATANNSDRERLSYFSFRLQNRWLCEIWPALDDYLPTPPGPWQLAIYYALAWTQFSTTWRWPETERWRALFGERPPAHWLPRAHWHLCWLSYDPKLTDHLQGLDEALEEGEADTALPGYAAAFREVLGRPGGSKGAQG